MLASKTQACRAAMEACRRFVLAGAKVVTIAAVKRFPRQSRATLHIRSG
jgi:hypothetical protein